ncbi:hypothetical protein FD06_GL000994 [Apilactobacillus ozensis DSM 23829 = JCM 17196]|uniref:TPR repeat-containing protein n=2 Tax=Apilactobacillus ozensis TaxID=866801 RepID=A0A0R2AZX6_9LACO|nr:hypothetical protein [Apilactobacillus ozensis]KRM68675.1 hypothetical protein FD06_GL000994 [Apilactobacillus ozensis DSM 23829 = JCM 17196]
MTKNNIKGLDEYYSDLYDSALDDKSNKNYDNAINKLTEIYNNKQLDLINIQLVKLLYKEHRYQEAFEYITLNPNLYLKNIELIKIFIEVLLNNHDFIFARKVVADFNDKLLKDKVILKISVAEKNYEEYFQKSLNSKVKEFAHLGNYEFSKQKSILESSMKIPLKYFVEYGEYLLLDSFVHPLIKSSIVDTFRELKLKININERFIDKKVRELNVYGLSKLESMLSYRNIISIVNESCLKNDPTSKMMFLQYLRVNLMIIYPFNDEIIKNYKLWFEYFYKTFTGRQFDSDTEEKEEINDIGNLILSIYSELFNI